MLIFLTTLLGTLSSVFRFSSGACTRELGSAPPNRRAAGLGEKTLPLDPTYAALEHVWVRLFIQSDPLNQEVEGPGVRFLRSLEWGTLAGLVGGVISSPVMLATGVLPKIAGTGCGHEVPVFWHRFA